MKLSPNHLVLAVILVLFWTGLSFGGNQYSDKQKYHTGGTMDHFKFSNLDINGDGSLSFDEYQKAFPAFERKGYDSLDTDKDRTLNPQEWQAFIDMHKGMGKSSGKKFHGKKKHHGAGLPDPSVFKALFKDMDTDADTRVTLSEFQSYFSGNEKTDKVFSGVDTDKNEIVDQNEWQVFKKAHNLTVTE